MRQKQQMTAAELLQVIRALEDRLSETQRQAAFWRTMPGYAGLVAWYEDRVTLVQSALAKVHDMHQQIYLAQFRRHTR